MKDELTNHLVSISKDAEILLNNLMESYKKSDEKLSEKSKETNQLEWVKLMNNYKNTAEEIILKELIYTENVWVRTHIFFQQALNLYSCTNSNMGIPIPLMFRKEILNYENKK